MRAKALRHSAIEVTLVAVMAAIIEAGKAALMTIPNVEVVTLFVALFGYVFGWLGLCATIVFVGLETLLWGFNTWVISYIVHWSCVCITFWILGRARVKNRFALTAFALVLVAAFGASSSLIDVAMFGGGRLTHFWRSFGIYYMSGIWFYVIELVCNAIVFPLLFPVLCRLLQKIARRYGLGVPQKMSEIAIEPADLPLEESAPQEVCQSQASLEADNDSV